MGTYFPETAKSSGVPRVEAGGDDCDGLCD